MAKNNIRPERLELKNIFVLQLESLESKDQPNGSLREAIQPYMFEAGLDPDLLANNTHLVAEGLMLFTFHLNCKYHLPGLINDMQMSIFNRKH